MLIVAQKALVDILMQKKMSCRDLELASGVTSAVIARLTRQDSRCRIQTVAKIADALNVDYRDLLKGGIL